MRFTFALSASALVLAFATGCASRAAAPAAPPSEPSEVDTSDPSFTPPGDGFVMVEMPKAEAKTAAPPPVGLPAPNHERARGTVHAATN